MPELPTYPRSLDVSYGNDVAPSTITLSPSRRYVYRVFDQGPQHERWEDPADEGGTRYMVDRVLASAPTKYGVEEALDDLNSSRVDRILETNDSRDVQRLISRT